MRGAWAVNEASGQAPVALVVDDDAQLRHLVAAVLERHGATVFTAGSAADALALMRSRDEAFDIIVTDVQMGRGLNGIELVEQIRRSRPGIAVLVISGEADWRQETAQKSMPFLMKPFSVRNLMERVEELLGRPLPVPPERKGPESAERVCKSGDSAA